MFNYLKAAKRRVSSLTMSKAERRHAFVGRSDLWEMKRRFQISFLKSQDLRQSHHLVDIGCGTLRGGLPIIEYLDPGHYHGIEVRERVLDEGRRELTESGLDHKRAKLISCSDISVVDFRRKFEFLWAFSVLIHMKDDILFDTMAFVDRHIGKQGVFLANVKIGAGGEDEWQGFPVVVRPYAFYEDACRSNNLVAEDIGALKELGHNSGVVAQDAQRMLRITKPV